MLTTEKLTKVTLIEDINKGVKLLWDRDITAAEFDELYDFTINELEHVNENISIQIDLMKLRSKL